MSGVFNAALVGVAGTLQDVLLRQGRSIAGIVPQVILEEQHTDDLMITEHPVEDGADITDHAVKVPSRLIMRCGWSQSGSNVPGLSLTQPSPRDAYKMLLDLQKTRQPFDVVTGKRTYSNMLIRRLTVVTDDETENALIVDVEMQEIIVVDTVEQRFGTVGALKTISLANPAVNSPLTNVGSVQLKDVTSTLPSQTVSDISALVP